MLGQEAGGTEIPPGFFPASRALLFLLLPCLLATQVWAQEAGIAPAGSPSVSVNPWPGSARGAVSITFDDAYLSHAEVAAPLLELHGYRGTFYLIVDRLLERGKYRRTNPSATLYQWRTMASKGHEIASHTLSHSALDSLGTGDLEEELRASKRTLEGMFGVPVESLSYPFAQANALTIESARAVYETGRLGPGTAAEPAFNDPGEVDLLKVRSLFLCSGEPADLWNGAVDSTLAGRGWLVETLHPIDEPGYCRINEYDFSRHIRYLAQLGESAWVAPIGEVGERIRTWRRTVVQVVKSTDQMHELAMSGSEGSGFTWRVFVEIPHPEEWIAVDEMGMDLAIIREENGLGFEWPDHVDRVVLRNRTLLNTEPVIAMTQPRQELSVEQGEDVFLAWEGENSDRGGEISVVLAWDTDEDIDNGFIQFSFEQPISGSIYWNVPRIAAGVYYLLAIITEGNGASSYGYAPGSVQVNPVAVDASSPFEPVYSGEPILPMELFVIGATVDGEPLAAADEIAVMDGVKVVGHAVLEGPISIVLPIAASTAEPGTENGFVAGNAISFRIWDDSAGREVADVGAEWRDLNTFENVPAPVFASRGQAILTLAGSGQITPGCTGDFDGNNIVNIIDFLAFADRFGTVVGYPGYEPAFDLKQDGRVDFEDFFRFVDAFGTECTEGGEILENDRDH